MCLAVQLILPLQVGRTLKEVARDTYVRDRDNRDFFSEAEFDKLAIKFKL